jgi:hypothetical protein
MEATRQNQHPSVVFIDFRTFYGSPTPGFRTFYGLLPRVLEPFKVGFIGFIVNKYMKKINLVETQSENHRLSSGL